MKISRFFMMTGIALLLCGQSLFSQEVKQDKAQQVKELIDSGNFVIEVNRAFPMSGRSVNLTSLYTIELKGDSVQSHLPYYGRAYSIPYGGGDGLRFDKQITEYQVSYDKKSTATINFNSRSEDDNFKFSLKVYPNASATVFVQPTNRQSISYHGDLILEKKE